MITWAEFVADKGRLPVWAAVLEPDDSSGNVDAWYITTEPPVGIEFCTGPADSPANQTFLPILESVGSYELAAGDPGQVGRNGDLQFRPLTAYNRFGELDGATGRNSWNELRWDGRPARIFLGGYSPLYGEWLPWAEWQAVQTLEMDEGFCSLERGEVSFRDQGERLRSKATRHKLGEFGYAYDLKGVASVSFGAAAKLNLRNDLSIMFRLYLNASPALSRLIGHDGVTYPFRVQLTAGRAIRFQDSSTTIDKTTTFTMTLKRWYSVLIRVSGTSMQIGFWDEWARTETLETFSVSSSTRATSSGTFYHSFPTNLTDGMIDEVAIASSPVSLSAWRRRRERRHTDVEAAGLVQLCRYDDGLLTTVTDSAPSPTNGTISGSGAWVPSLHGTAGSGLEGEVMPDPVGPNYGFSPVLIDEARAIYLVSCRPCQAIDAVYDGVAAVALNVAYTDLRTFLAATTLAGKHDTLIHAGGTFIRLGTPEQLAITVDLRGDASGSGYVDKAGDLISRIAQTRGADPLTSGEVSSIDVSTLNSANTSAVGMMLDGTVEDSLNFLAGSVGAVWWLDEAGQLRLFQVEAIKTSAVFALDDSNVISVEERRADRPVWEWVIDFRRNLTVLSPEQIASGARTTAAALAARAEWKHRRRYADDVLEAHPRARRKRRQTGLATQASAEAEAERLLELYQFGERFVVVEATLDAVVVKAWDVVSLEYHELGVDGETIGRLGLGSPVDFYVVSRFVRPIDGVISLLLWRPRDE